MINRFEIPQTYLFLILIPAAFIFIALLIRSLFETRMDEEKTRNIGRQLFWIIPAGIVGLLIWYIFVPTFSDKTFAIYFYGILITLGVIAAAFLAQAESIRRKLDPNIVWDALFWVVLAGIIGARLWHIFTPTKDAIQEWNITTINYLTHPLSILDIRDGGLGIPGAVLGGALALWLYCRNKKISFLTWADIIVPGVALAQAIGRWGNFFNQELYGKPIILQWKMFYIDSAHRLPGYSDIEYYHPLFFYESILNLFNMGLLLWLARRFPKWLKPGDLFLIYLLVYCVGRFSLDFLRLDKSEFNQPFVAVIALISAGIFIWRHAFKDQKQKARRARK